MINFIEKLAIAACGVLIAETAHALGYIKGATAVLAAQEKESKDHETE